MAPSAPLRITASVSVTAPGRRRGAADMDAAAERAIEQAFGREQIGVAIALDNAVRKAGDDRALRQDAGGDALEADFGFARRDGDPPGLADQRVAVQPPEIERPIGVAVRVAIDGDCRPAPARPRSRSSAPPRARRRGRTIRGAKRGASLNPARAGSSGSGARRRRWPGRSPPIADGHRFGRSGRRAVEYPGARRRNWLDTRSARTDRW